MKTKRIAVMILCLALLVVMGGESILSAFSISVMAADGSQEEIAYTNAYNDLRADKSFNSVDYPEVDRSDPKYYSLELITIAVSENNELFVYVYQPGGDTANIKASSIDISNSPRTDKTFKRYQLTYLNHYGVFYKYKVENFVASWTITGYYEISDILRPWSESYGDQKPGGDNTISEKAFSVGKLFTVSTDSRLVTVEDVEYITITNQFVGFARYEKDTIFPDYVQSDNTDAHFIAFSTDRAIDQLLEADIYYESQTYHSYKSGLAASVDPWSDVTEKYKYIDYEQKASCEVADGSLFTTDEHVWKRIMTTSKFLSQDTTYHLFPGFSIDMDLGVDEAAKQELLKTKWVISFAETEYSNWVHTDPINGSNGDYSIKYTRVGNVKILRLKFKTDGKIYNLGVVGDMQTGSEDPSLWNEQPEEWQIIIGLLLLILLIVAFSFLQGPVGAVAKVIWKGIKFLGKFLFAILSFPFRLLGWLFGKEDKKKPKGKRRYHE